METILVADDEAQVRSLARDILLGAGYRVLEAEDGEQALRVAEEHPGAIHVLLTDIMMPGINGKELADRLAAVRTDTLATSPSKPRSTPFRPAEGPLQRP